ncbi:MAG: endonuclease/exonuclease/phosphatase family protein [Verrucomicrobiota bacterium]
MGETIKVCTYNIQNLLDGINDPYYRTSLKTKRQTEGAARILSELNADIVFLQEIENHVILSRLNKLIEKPYPIAYITQFDDSKKINVALLSRVPIHNVRELEFSRWGDPAKPPRGTLRAEVDLGKNRRLLAYGVHLKSNHGSHKSPDEHEKNIAKRVAALRIIKDDVDRIQEADPEVNYESIIVGDFNTDPDVERFASDPTIDVLESWKDLWRGFPLDERTTLAERQGDPELAWPSICFDRVVVSPGLTKAPWRADRPHVLQKGVDIANIYVHPGENDIHVSDHYPVYVELRR